MTDEERSDYAIAPGSPKTTTPPMAKIAREWTLPIGLAGVLVAITVALIVGKLSEIAFVGFISSILAGLLGRSKPEGVVGEQTLERIVRSR